MILWQAENPEAPMSYFKRSQAKYVKKPYRVRNWSTYEAGLQNRGSLTVWLSEEELSGWEEPRRQPGKRKRGRQKKYTNHAIETALTVGMLFHLRLRQAEGFLRSLFELLDVSGSTVRTRLQRGLAMLRERLDGQTGTDRRTWCLALIPLARP